MARKLSRSFFWIDQQIIRSGVWMKLSPQARLAYVAISASVDREGLSIWHPTKLMELAGIKQPEEFDGSLGELIEHRLIESLSTHVPAAIRLCVLPFGESEDAPTNYGRKPSNPSQTTPIVIHTHTTVQVGGEPPRAES